MIKDGRQWAKALGRIATLLQISALIPVYFTKKYSRKAHSDARDKKTSAKDMGREGEAKEKEKSTSKQLKSCAQILTEIRS